LTQSKNYHSSPSAANSTIASCGDSSFSEDEPFLSALTDHVLREKVSFHTPGHKGRLELFPRFVDVTSSSASSSFSTLARLDLTELSTLDELAQPSGIIAALEQRASRAWSSRASFLSVNGASCALKAVLWACARQGGTVLLPRNAHKSVIEAALLFGCEIEWLEPHWHSDWGFWGAVSLDAFKSAFAKTERSKLRAAVITSPTYQGSISELRGISAFCRENWLPLIVDEAHGAYFNAFRQENALFYGADFVAHSLHKVLPGLTQTGILHLGHHSKIEPELVRQAMAMFTSTSPSYLLMASMEKAIACAENSVAFNAYITGLRHRFLEGWQSHWGRVYEGEIGQSAAHILVWPSKGDSAGLARYLEENGVFAEASFGRGLLFMLGAGSLAGDVDLLLELLTAYFQDSSCRHSLSSTGPECKTLPALYPPQYLMAQEPSVAIRRKTQMVERADAPGRIAAQLISACPPGVPILIPGQIITEEVLTQTDCAHFCVVAE
jgi:arginine/lysine/ornithine decarboxylase